MKNQHDIDVIRRLAARKAEIAQDPVNLERKRAWYALDEGMGDRPMVLAEQGGIRDQNPPVPKDDLECRDEGLRNLEYGLRAEIYQFEELKDDHVVEAVQNVNWRIRTSDYGVQAVQHQGNNEGRMGSVRWDPPIRDLDEDFDKLHARTYSVDREGTLKGKADLEGILGDTLPVRIRGAFWWTLGLTWRAIDLIGLENLMLFMYDNPEGLHRLMAFLRDDHLAYAKWLEREDLLSLNNGNDYIGSGSIGYTRRFPQPDAPADGRVRTRDQWVLLESQETVGVGPDQFEAFIFPYQASLAEHFGSVYYGCCEPVHTRWHVLKRLDHLERVSVSPWCDEDIMGREMGRRYVYSRKPNPSLISTERFDEDAIRADLRKTLEAARGCRLEVIMKDVHTLNNEPSRLARWVALAREAIDEAYG